MTCEDKSGRVTGKGFQILDLHTKGLKQSKDKAQNNRIQLQMLKGGFKMTSMHEQLHLTYFPK